MSDIKDNNMSTNDFEEESLVDSLKNMAYIIDECARTGSASLTMLSGSIFIEAAEQIERLIDAGDALVNVLRSGSDTGWDNAIDAWEDVRHVKD